jgi:hypothetical protein
MGAVLGRALTCCCANGCLSVSVLHFACLSQPLVPSPLRHMA